MNGQSQVTQKRWSRKFYHGDAEYTERFLRLTASCEVAAIMPLTQNEPSNLAFKTDNSKIKTT